MDHREVEERDLVPAYLRGELSADEEARFEEHLLECTACFERVRWEDELGTGLREAAAEDLVTAAASGAAVPVSEAPPVRGGGTWRPALLAAALVVAIALPAHFLWQRDRRGLELAAERAVAAERSRLAAVEGELAETRRRLGEEIASLGTEVRSERAAREDLAGRLARLSRPQVNTPIFRLGASRGAGTERPANRIALGAEPEWIVLTFELPAIDFPAYRAALSRDGGEPVWRGDGLLPDATGGFTLILPSTTLAPGTYRLHLQGRTTAGRDIPVADFRFEVTGTGMPSR